MLEYNVDDRVGIKLGSSFLVIGGEQIDVRESTLKIRLDDEDVVFKVNKPLNAPLHYKNLWMITIMDVDKCGVVECSSPMTSLDYLIEWYKLPNKPKVVEMKEDLQKAIVEKDANLESQRSKGKKIKKIASE